MFKMDSEQGNSCSPIIKGNQGNHQERMWGCSWWSITCRNHWVLRHFTYWSCVTSVTSSMFLLYMYCSIHLYFCLAWTQRINFTKKMDIYILVWSIMKSTSSAQWVHNTPHDSLFQLSTMKETSNVRTESKQQSLTRKAIRIQCP